VQALELEKKSSKEFSLELSSNRSSVFCVLMLHLFSLCRLIVVSINSFAFLAVAAVAPAFLTFFLQSPHVWSICGDSICRAFSLAS